jgi:hypothetical protein
MELQQLTDFFNAATPDKRMGAAHISLYMALFQFWSINSFQNPIALSRSEIMPVAKINARATYHKCMKDLEDYGYIKYVPSYNPFLKSLIYILKLGEKQ